MLFSLLEDQRERAPKTPRRRVLSNKGTPRSFCGPVARPLRGLCRSPKHSIVRLEEWLEHNEANEVSRPRSPFVLAVLEFLRLANVRGPVNACDTFHVHARQTRCAAFLVMRTRVSVVWMCRARAVRRGQWNSNNMERVTGYKHNLRRGQP